MHRTFGLLMVASFIVVNENVVNAILAMVVANYSFSDAIGKATQYYDAYSYLFSAAFRSIPYLALALVLQKTTLVSTTLGKIAALSALGLITVIHFCGYWDMQHSLYTTEHTSSTASLGIVFLPLFATLVSMLVVAMATIAVKVRHKKGVS